MYISFWASFPCKPVFKSEFYSRFVSFDIKDNHHIEYGIKPSSSSIELNGLQLYGRVTEGATYRLKHGIYGSNKHVLKGY
jgi:hypothetical protein